MKAKFDLQETITQKIIDALEKGVRPWEKPWTGSEEGFALPLRSNGIPYRGVNVMLLWMEQAANAYRSNYWLSFKQVGAEGGKVRKGQKSTMVVKWVITDKFDEDKKPVLDKNGRQEKNFYPRYYLVFNADQCDDLPEKFFPPKPVELTDKEKAKVRLERIEHAEAFFKATKGVVKHGGVRAFYRPSEDFIQLPELDAFKNIESYYATMGHEFVHWTGHTSRLDRDFTGRFGEEKYAAEELVAEIGAAILCSGLGISSSMRDDHAAYIKGWLKILKDDKKFILSAAGSAQRAVDMIAGFSGEQADEEEAEDVKVAA